MQFRSAFAALLSVAATTFVSALWAPAEATPAGCSVSIATAAIPGFGVISVARDSCPNGPPAGNSLTNPAVLDNFTYQLFSVAPPTEQFYEFSTQSLLLDIQFLSTPDFQGALELFDINDALLGSSTITNGVGDLNLTGLGIGQNYILDVIYGAVVDPTFSVTFSTPVNKPIPEPFTLSLFGAGLVGAAALRHKANKKA